MERISNFLWKIFCIGSVFCYGSTDSFDAIAETTSTTEQNVYSSTTTKEGMKRINICPAGYYVSKCGNFSVGYNWLKSIRIDNTTRTNDYTVSSDPVTRFDQMRRFFHGQYTTGWASTNGTVNKEEPAKQISTQSDRDTILGAVCNPNNVKKDSSFSYTCTPCPEAGTVGPSYVYAEYTASSLLIPNSWTFHSIADCYISQFTDTTGSFIYLPSNLGSNTTQDGKYCYYGDNVSTTDFNRNYMGTSIGSVETGSDLTTSVPAQNLAD
jgi:hypothetical protein